MTIKRRVKMLETAVTAQKTVNRIYCMSETADGWQDDTGKVWTEQEMTEYGRQSDGISFILIPAH